MTATATVSRTTWLLLAGAVAYATLLPVAAMTAPVYSGGSEGTEETGAVAAPTQTFYEANGTWGLVLSAVPLIMALVAVTIVAVGGTSRWTQRLALIPVGLLGLLSLAGMLSVGIFFLPVVGMLGLGVLLIPARLPAPNPLQSGAPAS